MVILPVVNVATISVNIVVSVLCELCPLYQLSSIQTCVWHFIVWL